MAEYGKTRRSVTIATDSADPDAAIAWVREQLAAALGMAEWARWAVRDAMMTALDEASRQLLEQALALCDRAHDAEVDWLTDYRRGGGAGG